MGTRGQNWKAFICSHKDFVLGPSLGGHLCPALWSCALKWQIRGQRRHGENTNTTHTYANTMTLIQGMFCDCNTSEDSSQMPVVLMRFLCLIKFMDFYESGLRHLPEKKNKLKLAQ